MPGALRSSAPFVLACGLAAGLALAPQGARAATGSQTTYLKFEKGNEALATQIARVEETLEIDSIGMAKKPYWYLVRGLAGQRITLRLSGDPGTQVLVSCPASPGYADVRETPWSFDLPDSGDYLLRLQADGAKEGSTYKASLEVELFTRRKPVPPNATGLYGRDGGEDAMIDVAQGEDGTIRFYLFAFWKGGQLPEIAGQAPIDKGTATYKDGDCALTFHFKEKEGSLDLQGAGSCSPGIQEAVVGNYKRVSRCGFPRAPGR